MKLQTESYLTQKSEWPDSGRHILAHFDDAHIVVYQAYREEIGRFAAENQAFGGAFSYSRMSWIKPNFLWMMYRSGWGSKEGQEVVLAVTIPRALFDEILEQAVPSTFTTALYSDVDEWKKAGASSDVRLQWDPDHAPKGAPQERRAIQLGLRGEILKRYGAEEVVQIEDISEFVREQRERLDSSLESLEIPRERVYYPASEAARRQVGLETEAPVP